MYGGGERESGLEGGGILTVRRCYQAKVSLSRLTVEDGQGSDFGSSERRGKICDCHRLVRN